MSAVAEGSLHSSNSMTGLQRVVLVVAMEQEAAPFIRKHGLAQMTPSPFLTGMPMVCYTGRLHGSNNQDSDSSSSIEIFLVWTGRDQRYKVNNVATTAASVATYASLTAFAPVDLVLSAGTAGGFAAVGAAVGDVYLSTKCVFHNRRIPSGADYEEYGFGHFRSPSLPLLAAACGLKQGVVSTSDSLDHSPIDLELMRGEGAAVKEMEAAAVAWVCQQGHVPFLAVKSITDIVDGPETVDTAFYANLRTASDALQEKLSHILELLRQAPLSHWAGGSGVGGLPSAAAVATDRGVEATVGQGAGAEKTTSLVIPRVAVKARYNLGNTLTAALPLVAGVGMGVLLGVTFSKRTA
jgi:5'-methylthioadenosine nucleosidase